ncbi:hypothetical protein EV175_006573, partial [Coemansia sp. RSA 1933]
MSTPPDNTGSALPIPEFNKGGNKRKHPDSSQISTLRHLKLSAHSSNDPPLSFRLNSKEEEANDNDNDNDNANHNATVVFTPVRSKPSHSNSKDNLGKTLTKIREEHEEYAKLQDMEKLRKDIAVANMARPRSDVLADLSANVAQRVTQKLERLLDSDNSNNEYTHLTKWTRQDNHAKETPMYLWISDFFGFVSREIGLAHAEFTAAARSIDSPLALLPFEMTNVNPDGSDDYTRTDILLRANRRDAGGDGNAQNLAAKPNYKDVVAVIE